ncbi:FAD:protein FMN transferase [Prevotella sp. P6B4]|uniref:FAD:protein FMN transferase n=1 Tax=Prevotella sp. P6B4 TaxID=1410614 RepID=UPI000491F783|nr:FAD:protein FMN transferase [Prevotella sp. P6B4]
MQKQVNKKLMWQLPFLVLLIVGTVLIIRQQRNLPYQKSADKVFGTFYHAVYQCDSDLTYSINAELAKVDLSLSPFNKQSIITVVNQNQDVKLNDMFLDVYQLAMKISKETDGAFDITVAPLVNAWGFGFKNGIEPTKEQVDSLMQIVGYQKVSLEKGRIHKTDPRIMLDCSAIAKGYGTDVVARLLRSKGINNFMIEIGGEIVTSGVNPEQKPWRVGISKPVEDPQGVGQGVQSIIAITDKAMATSGNYRNFYYKDGKRYAHTIDPKTGYPVQHSILSATVFANSCAMADAYATSFMVMGVEKAQMILNEHPELMAYLIYSDQNGKNAVWYSPSLKNKIQQ